MSQHIIKMALTGRKMSSMFCRGGFLSWGKFCRKGVCSWDFVTKGFCSTVFFRGSFVAKGFVVTEVLSGGGGLCRSILSRGGFVAGRSRRRMVFVAACVFSQGGFRTEGGGSLSHVQPAVPGNKRHADEQ